jgi:hypothetical protein
MQETWRAASLEAFLDSGSTFGLLMRIRCESDATDHYRTLSTIAPMSTLTNQITFAYVFIYAWSVCVIKFSILALYRRIFGLSWLGYCCVGITIGYLITNHIVLPIYTRPLSYYWNQWYGAEGEVLIDEAKVCGSTATIDRLADQQTVLPGRWHHQPIWRYVHIGGSDLKCTKAAHGTHSEDRHMLHVSAWQFVSHLFRFETIHDLQ